MKLLGAKGLALPARPGLVAYCPTMDLVAVVSEEEHVDVYRVLGGQRVFGFKRKSAESAVTAVAWKYNGESPDLV